MIKRLRHTEKLDLPFAQMRRDKKVHKAGGYSLKLFESPLPSTLMWGMCTMVLREPIKCEKCSRLVCRGCIEDNLATYFASTKSFKCNECHELVPMREAEKGLKKVIGKLLVQCKHSGCSETMPLKNWEGHKKSCGWKEVGCQKSDCTQRGSVQDFIKLKVQTPWISDHRYARDMYACSQRCAMVIQFQEMVSCRATALSMYYNLLTKEN